MGGHAAGANVRHPGKDRDGGGGRKPVALVLALRTLRGASGLGHVGMVFEPVLLSCAFRFLHGIGDGVVLLVFYRGVATLFVAERLGGNAGVVNTMTMVGMVLGALVFGPLGEAFGYGVPLWTSGLLTMLLALPVLVLQRSPKRSPGVPSPLKASS
jgi:MFS family permease